MKAASGFNDLRLYAYEGDILVEKQNIPGVQGSSYEHISALGSPDEACFVGCGSVSEVLCLKESGDSLSLILDSDATQTLTDSANCFHSSSVTIIKEPPSSSITMLATASHQSTRTGTIDIYDVTVPATLTKLQTINCHMCSHTALGRYKDEIFIVVLSETYDFVSLGKWDPEDRGGRFKVFQSIKLPKPTDAIFFNHDEFLYLSITTGNRENTEIKRFMFRGSMAFTEMEEMNLRLVGIQSHMIISHPLLQTPLISSTGNVLFYSFLILTFVIPR